MSQFEEPDVLCALDRSFGDRKEELRLERGQYEGKPTFTLRLHWRGNDERWRWAKQKPTQSGNCWERLNLKSGELKKLGEALIAASKDVGAQRQAAPQSRAAHVAVAADVDDDDIPF